MAGFTQTNLDNLEKAIAAGVLTVEIDGVRTTYQSLDALLKLRNLMLDELGVSSNRQRQTRVVYSR
jgi:hypothetical protein